MEVRLVYHPVTVVQEEYIMALKWLPFSFFSATSVRGLNLSYNQAMYRMYRELGSDGKSNR